MAIKPQFIACLLKVKQRPNQNENKQIHQIRLGFFFVFVFITNVECKTKDKILERINIFKLIIIEKQKYVHHRTKQPIISDQRHILAETFRIKLVTKQFEDNATNRWRSKSRHLSPKQNWIRTTSRWMTVSKAFEKFNLQVLTKDKYCKMCRRRLIDWKIGRIYQNI